MPDDNLTQPHQPAPDLPTGEPLPVGDRYILSKEIARGGMGAIYRADDTVLNREVAIKVLQEQFPADSPLARRFVEEAQITAQLQHPGIPPVQDQGTFADGRPFLAMKLIKGQSLADLLHKRDRASGGREPAVPDERQPADIAQQQPVDTGRSPDLVSVFEAIAQAVGFAHSRGIIHRDLKPANVMVGEFGEVQVMDWGLAKQLASRAASAAGSSDDASKGDTRSPEQHGSPDADPDRTTDQTADLSTDERTRAGQALGTPAFMPPEQARGETDRIDARSDVFGLGAILCAILTNRPPFVAASAQLARRMAAEGKLDDTFARLDACGADAELIALCKRCLSADPEARPENGGEVAALVAQYRAGVEERLRTAERNRAAAEAKAIEQRKKRRVQLALAGAVLVIAFGGAAFGWWADRIASEKREAALRQDAEEKLRIARNGDTLEAAVTRGEAALRRGDVKGVENALAEFDQRSPDGGGEAFTARVEQCRTDLPLLRALNEVDQYRWTARANNLPGREEVVQCWNAALAENKLDVRGQPTDELVRLIEPSHLRPRIEVALDVWLIVTREPKLRELLHALDADPFRSTMRNATLADQPDAVAELASRPEAERQPASFIAALGEHPSIPLVLRRELLEIAVRAQPQHVTLLLILGSSYPINQREGAEERIRWFQAAATTDPSNAVAHTNLGVALHDKGDLNGAIAAYREAIRLDPKNVAAHTNLGVALYDKGDLNGAIAAYREAIRLDPKNAAAYSNLGAALRDKGDLNGAIAAYRESIHLDPKFAPVNYNLGKALREKGDLDGAIAAYREAIRLDSKDAEAHNGLGNALSDKGDREGAIAAYREAIRLNPKFANAFINLGNALFDQGDREGAIAAYREAIRLNPQDAPAHYNLGNVLALSGDLDGAIAAFQEADRLLPRHPQIQRNLALARKQKAERDAKAAAPMRLHLPSSWDALPVAPPVVVAPAPREVKP